MNAGSVRDALNAGAELLADTSRAPRRDAQSLLGYVLRRERAWLLAYGDSPLAPEQQAQYAALLARRAQHEPMQYILGEQEFYGLRLAVTPAVLIPRPETEHLVEAVLARMPADRSVRIADVGTGSGAIAIALAHALPNAVVDALDLSDAALVVARENAAQNNVSDRVHFLHSDLLAAVSAQTYDCIASNPPYIPAGELLEPQVAQWEPGSALFAGDDGLAVYRRLLPQASSALRPGGLLALEIGAGQQASLEQLFGQDPSWIALEFLPDLQGIPRVALAQLTESER